RAHKFTPSPSGLDSPFSQKREPNASLRQRETDCGSAAGATSLLRRIAQSKKACCYRATRDWSGRRPCAECLRRRHEKGPHVEGFDEEIGVEGFDEEKGWVRASASPVPPYIGQKIGVAGLL